MFFHYLTKSKLRQQKIELICSKKMAGNRSGADRVLIKLKKSVEEGQYYEAHQMYRTLYFR